MERESSMLSLTVYIVAMKKPLILRTPGVVIGGNLRVDLLMVLPLEQGRLLTVCLLGGPICACRSLLDIIC